MENKNITISEYLEEIVEQYNHFSKIKGMQILEKLKDGKRLSKSEIYFIALQFNLIEDYFKLK